MYKIRKNTIIRQGDGLVCFRNADFDKLQKHCDRLNLLLGQRTKHIYNKRVNVYPNEIDRLGIKERLLERVMSIG